eukprot:jgi/Psemu1/241/gm1.241_g
MATNISSKAGRRNSLWLKLFMVSSLDMSLRAIHLSVSYDRLEGQPATNNTTLSPTGAKATEQNDVSEKVGNIDTAVFEIVDSHGGNRNDKAQSNETIRFGRIVDLHYDAKACIYGRREQSILELKLNLRETMPTRTRQHAL